MPRHRADALDALRPRSFGGLPGLVDQSLVAVLGLLELFSIALPELGRALLDGRGVSRFFIPLFNTFYILT